MTASKFSHEMKRHTGWLVLQVEGMTHDCDFCTNQLLLSAIIDRRSVETGEGRINRFRNPSSRSSKSFSIMLEAESVRILVAEGVAHVLAGPTAAILENLACHRLHSDRTRRSGGSSRCEEHSR